VIDTAIHQFLGSLCPGLSVGGLIWLAVTLYRQGRRP
jgi:hypothetical protein